jgi:hypothetical protein
MKAKILKSGKCCHYKWFLFHNTSMTSFFQFWWLELRKAYSFHVSHHTENLFVSQDVGSFKLIIRDSSGVKSFLTPEFGICNSMKLDAIEAIGVNLFPGRRIKSPLRPAYLKDLPLISANTKEEYLLLPPAWDFIHYARYDLLIVNRTPDSILVVCPDNQDGFAGWLMSS